VAVFLWQAGIRSVSIAEQCGTHIGQQYFLAHLAPCKGSFLYGRRVDKGCTGCAAEGGTALKYAAERRRAVSFDKLSSGKLKDLFFIVRRNTDVKICDGNGNRRLFCTMDFFLPE
jgi:hypothetical protein